MEKKKVLLVFKIRIAKELLRRGYTVIDVMPNQRQPQKTVFVFDDDGKIFEDFAQIKADTWQD